MLVILFSNHDAHTRRTIEADHLLLVKAIK